MSVLLDTSNHPLLLHLKGPVPTEEAAQVSSGITSWSHTQRVRPALLINAQEAMLPVVLWTHQRRLQLAAFLRSVGPIAIVTAEPTISQAAKLALDPFGSHLIWRVFSTLEEGRIWLCRIEQHGKSIWDTNHQQPRLSPKQTNALLRAMGMQKSL